MTQLSLLLTNNSNSNVAVNMFQLSDLSDLAGATVYQLNVLNWATITSQPDYFFSLIYDLNGFPQNDQFSTNPPDWNTFINDFNSFFAFAGFVATGGSDASPIANIAINDPLNFPTSLETFYNIPPPILEYSYAITQANVGVVTSAIPDLTYRLIKYSQMGTKYLIEELYISSTVKEQVTQSVQIQYKDADGARVVNNITPIYDPYQYTNNLLMKLTYPIVLDGETAVNLVLLPNSVTRFYLKGKQVSLTENLGEYYENMKITKMQAQSSPSEQMPQHTYKLVFTPENS
jgi:hypothetical protein